MATYQLRNILIVLMLALSTLAYSQIGTEFWFAAPEVTAQHADRPIYLRLASFQQASTVTISMPANPSFTPILVNVPLDRSISVDLTAYIDLIESKPPYSVLNSGLLIQATRPVTAYYEVVGSRNQVNDGENRNSDIFALKGNNALGTEFYTPFQTFWANVGNRNAYSSFDIVATENNTEVKIIPSVDVPGFAVGDTITVILNRGQTYSVRAAGISQAQHMAGSHIISSKPIAVTVKDDSVLNATAYDLIGDQIVPVKVLGDEYIVTKGKVTPADKAFVLAAQDSTIIFIDGVLTDTIMKGETFTVDVSNPFMHIEVSNPSYVFHVSGFGKELAGALLPPTRCTGSPFVSFTRSSAYPFFLNVLVEAGAEDGFTINGSPGLLPASAFQVVPGTEGKWMAAHLKFSEAQIAVGSSNLISNNKGYFHVGTISGLATGASGLYGYFSNFAKLELGKVDEPLCPGEIITIDAGDAADRYVWKMETDTGWVVVGNTNSIVVDSTGQYAVEQHKGLTCVLHDTISVFFNPEIKVNLGPDTLLCPENTYVIDAGNQFTAYVWQDSSTSRFFTPDTTGDYWIETVNQYNCKSRDSINVTFRDFYTIDLGSDTAVCFGETVVLLPGDTLKSYLWNDGSTLDSLIARNTGEYSVIVTNSHGCLSYDTLNLLVRPFYDIDLGPDPVVCFGDSATFYPGSFPLYLWHDQSADSSFTTDTSGVFSVQVENEFGCTAEDTVEVVVNPLPDFTLGKDTVVCSGTPVTLDPGAFKLYLWQDGKTSRTYSITVSDTYIVEVTNNFDCKNSDTVEVVVNPLPVADLGPNQIICDLDSVYLYPGHFTEYIWINNSTDTSMMVRTTGDYWVKVKNVFGCEDIDSVHIQVNPNPDPQLGPDLIYCADETKTITPGNFSKYLWNTGAISSSITLIRSGEYYVTVENSFGCKKTDTIGVTVRPLPEPFLGNDTVICSGNSVVLTPGSGFASYLWNDGSTSPSLTANNNGLYFVKVQNQFNCEKTDSLNIAFFPSFSVDAGPDQSICPGEAVTLTATVSNRTTGVTYEWSPQASSNASVTVFPNIDSKYKIVVRDANGCAPVSDEVIIFVHKLLAKPFVDQEVKHCFENGPVSLDAGEATAYSWLPTGETSRVINATGAGNYYVTVFNQFGCPTTDTILISPICPPRLFVPKAFTPNGDGNNEYVDIFGDHFKNFHMTIFNRWGEVIYMTSDRNMPWDGNYRGEVMPDDVYPWVISYESLYENDPENPRKLKGAVMLIK